ncbi:MAG: glutaminase A [Myxococcales bacterium]|nr:glutaminase A [Myxococcales bacterium]
MSSLKDALDTCVADARTLTGGSPATYIPELASVDLEATSAAIVTVDGEVITAGDGHRFTMQSSAKLVLLAGLLEERGPEAVFDRVGTEPSGGSFSSLARLETHGPRPANPLVNAGAIALAGMLDGPLEDRLAWIDGWATRLYGAPVPVNLRVAISERRTGDRNRAIAWFLKSAGVLREVDDVLETYFTLCSLEATCREAAHLGAVLARGGGGVISPRTAGAVLAIMATCGMYDESGAHLVETGMPAKSGVSGVIVAVAPGRAGVAVSSPRINDKGGSIRGHAMLRSLSRQLGWHLA